MKDRIINCLSILGVALLWAVFIILVFCSCNSTKHVQTATAQHDSTVVQHHDSTAVSTASTEERVSNERIMEMLFGMQQAIDDKGRPIVTTYPTTLRIIERGSTEKTTAAKDSVHLARNDTAHIAATVATVVKDSRTRVFPLWWLFAIGLAGLALGFVTRFFKISKR